MIIYRMSKMLGIFQCICVRYCTAGNVPDNNEESNLSTNASPNGPIESHPPGQDTAQPIRGDTPLVNNNDESGQHPGESMQSQPIRTNPSVASPTQPQIEGPNIADMHNDTDLNSELKLMILLLQRQIAQNNPPALPQEPSPNRPLINGADNPPTTSSADSQSERSNTRPLYNGADTNQTLTTLALTLLCRRLLANESSSPQTPFLDTYPNMASVDNIDGANPSVLPNPSAVMNLPSRFQIHPFDILPYLPLVQSSHGFNSPVGPIRSFARNQRAEKRPIGRERTPDQQTLHSAASSKDSPMNSKPKLTISPGSSKEIVGRGRPTKLSTESSLNVLVNTALALAESSSAPEALDCGGSKIKKTKI